MAVLLVAAETVFPAMPVLIGVGVVGFVAAVSIGSVAWYNSERPAGWEGRERPGFIPDTTRKDK
ncbi:MAG: photosystem II assembly protein Psb35 [Thermosynechococcaceae cyanobacterium]